MSKVVLFCYINTAFGLLWHWLPGTSGEIGSATGLIIAAIFLCASMILKAIREIQTKEGK